MGNRWPPFDSRDMVLLASMGELPDFTTENKFGFASAVPNSAITIWPENSIYVYPSSASTMTVSSSDNDDVSGGAGARTVEIYGLDSSYDEASETITMNGQTAVTTNSYIRCHRMIVRTAGNTGSNEGIIYWGTGALSTGKPANVYAEISAGFNQTLQCAYTVPNGKTAYIYEILYSAGSGREMQGSLCVQPLNEVMQVKELVVLYQTGLPFPMPFLKVEAKSNIELRGVVDASTSAAGCSFSMLIQTN